MYVFYKGMAGSNKATGATFGATFDLPDEQLSLVALVAFWEQLVDGPSLHLRTTYSSGNDE